MPFPDVDVNLFNEFKTQLYFSLKIVNMYYVIIILLLCIDPGERVAHAIQALECDKDVGDVTAVDLMGPGECDTSKRDYDETEVHQLQLIYTEESHSLEVMKCTAVVDRYVAYCGKVSRAKARSNAKL